MFRICLYLFLIILDSILLGGYIYAAINKTEVIESHRWVITIGFILTFLIFLLSDKRIDKRKNI